jgi:hypothetical protein
MVLGRIFEGIRRAKDRFRGGTYGQRVLKAMKKKREQRAREARENLRNKAVQTGMDKSAYEPQEKKPQGTLREYRPVFAGQGAGWIIFLALILIGFMITQLQRTPAGPPDFTKVIPLPPVSGGGIPSPLAFNWVVLAIIALFALIFFLPSKSSQS